MSQTFTHSIHAAWYEDRQLYAVSIWDTLVPHGESLACTMWLNHESMLILHAEIANALQIKERKSENS